MKSSIRATTFEAQKKALGDAKKKAKDVKNKHASAPTKANLSSLTVATDPTNETTKIRRALIDEIERNKVVGLKTKQQDEVEIKKKAVEICGVKQDHVSSFHEKTPEDARQTSDIAGHQSPFDRIYRKMSWVRQVICQHFVNFLLNN
ncbi:hypothetical protein L1987_20677 [Smallanthus sonchifolius]|uniref:Uncharacterized protein n=1 Tax=Smallanthus sonchifolius TaxID=185202 RepID=A0ACB9ITZ4_9ASTR|nr:hypothetical protein L1987_20677 [Smallanthus sonchifolius]